MIPRPCTEVGRNHLCVWEENSVGTERSDLLVAEETGS